MKYPTISVIIPVFNAVDTIQRCIESVLEQTVSVNEIIVVNDGSTDKIESFLQSYKLNNNLDNLNIITQANGGPAKARNRGIIEAKGEWIAFLDADDEWFPEKIERQVAILCANPNCVIIGTTSYSSKHNDAFIKVTFNKMLFKNYFITSSVLVRKNILSENLFDEQKRYSEDYKLWLQIIKWHEGILMNQGLVIYADNQNRYNRKSLSNCLWKMERAELSNFHYLLKGKFVNIITFIIISLFSLIKFFKRVLVSSLHI